MRNGHHQGAEKHLRRLADDNPGSGQIRVLKLTEKQYFDIRMLTGEEGYQGKMIGWIFSKIRTEVEKLRPSVRKFRKYERKDCQISIEIRTEMGKLRPSVRKFRKYERKDCQIFGKIRTEVEKLRPSVRISREAENGFEIFLHPESQT